MRKLILVLAVISIFISGCIYKVPQVKMKDAEVNVMTPEKILEPSPSPSLNPKPSPSPTEKAKASLKPSPTPKIVEKTEIPKTKSELISSVTIQLKNEPGTVNARVAAKIVNGYILKSGEIFSYNKVVGERTTDKGFITGSLPIKKINGEQEIIDSVGSGVCRLSVGLATAAKRAGLKQIEIWPHQYTPSYFNSKNPNLVDATVYWESNLDNKFKNNKEYDIKIVCDVDKNSALHVSFYKLS
jgi:vancomycin resistance protein YoaR